MNGICVETVDSDLAAMMCVTFSNILALSEEIILFWRMANAVSIEK